MAPLVRTGGSRHTGLAAPPHRNIQLKNKKVGTIVVGGSPVDSIQYELIDKQFDCMAKYLSWNLLFQKSYYATAKDELSKNQDAMKELEDIGKEL